MGDDVTELLWELRDCNPQGPGFAARVRALVQAAEERGKLVGRIEGAGRMRAAAVALLDATTADDGDDVGYTFAADLRPELAALDIDAVLAKGAT